MESTLGKVLLNLAILEEVRGAVFQAAPRVLFTLPSSA